MLTLIRGAEVFAPDPLGSKDLLVAGERIVALASPDELQLKGAQVLEIDGRGLRVIPGLVDSHVHILGGGGEGGPATRAPSCASRTPSRPASPP